MDDAVFNRTKNREKTNIKCKLGEEMAKRQTNFRDDTVPDLNEQDHSRRGINKYFKKILSEH